MSLRSAHVARHRGASPEWWTEAGDWTACLVGGGVAMAFAAVGLAWLRTIS